MTSSVKMQLFDLEKGAQQSHPGSKQSTGLNSTTCAASAEEACLVARGVLGVTSPKHSPSQCLAAACGCSRVQEGGGLVLNVAGALTPGPCMKSKRCLQGVMCLAR